MRSIHMIGIEGIGMSGLAKLLLAAGYKVSGCDLKPGDNCRVLAQQGAEIVQGHAFSHLSHVDEVVVSPAVDKIHPELEEAARQGIPIWRYTEMLGHLMRSKKQLAVAGTHGKSTTTGMLTYLMDQAQLDPSFVVGAMVPQLGTNARLGQSPYFVVEACEYRRSFLNFTPHIAIITNIELDHLDYYRDLDDIASAFAELARMVPANGLVVAGSEACSRLPKNLVSPVESYSSTGQADWQAVNIAKAPYGHSFEVLYQGQVFGRFTVTIPGVHNISNALAVIAVGHHLGLTPATMQQHIATYRGVARRFEILVQSPVTVITDYAHHPAKIQAVLQAARECFPTSRIWTVFQPHQASRTYHLFAAFTKSFGLTDKVIVTDIFFARDSAEDRSRVSAKKLAESIQEQGKDACYIGEFAEVVKFLKTQCQPGDIVLNLGAGSIDELAHTLARELTA